MPVTPVPRFLRSTVRLGRVEIGSIQIRETITQHSLTRAGAANAPYLVYEPEREVERDRRALVVYLHGAGGSLDDYNLAREPVYAPIRTAIAANGWTLLVPYLGGRHFMSDDAQHTLDVVLDHVLAERDIPPSRVHLLGTSMGGGSALAYIIRRPGRIRSACAIMPMTDFALFARENPTYGGQMATAYGASVDEDDSTYRLNSAVLHPDAYADTPIMLFHGLDDPTVDPGHSRRLAHLLQDRGHECQYFPVEGRQHESVIISGHQSKVVAFFEAAMNRGVAITQQMKDVP